MNFFQRFTSRPLSLGRALFNLLSLILLISGLSMGMILTIDFGFSARPFLIMGWLGLLLTFFFHTRSNPQEPPQNRFIVFASIAIWFLSIGAGAKIGARLSPLTSLTFIPSQPCIELVFLPPVTDAWVSYS